MRTAHTRALVGRRERGFTLVELLVVISMISILAAMGVVQYRNSVQRTRETTLRHDLFEIRDVIDQVLRRQGQVPIVARLAGQRRLHAQDPDRSDHQLHRHLADGPCRSRSGQPVSGAGHLRREERRLGHGAGRVVVFGLVGFFSGLGGSGLGARG